MNVLAERLPSGRLPNPLKVLQAYGRDTLTIDIAISLLHGLFPAPHAALRHAERTGTVVVDRAARTVRLVG